MSKKKVITIKERIISIFNEFSIPEEREGVKAKFINSVMELIERAKSPEIFCQKCDTRMSIDLESGNLHCFNCGARKKIEGLTQPIIRTGVPSAEVIPLKTELDTKQPDSRLLKAIDKAEKGVTNKGKSILNLASSRGQSKITKEDNDMIKNTVPGAKNTEVNWS